MKYSKSIVQVLAGVVLAGVPVRAGFVTYTNQLEFLAAVSGVEIIDFDSMTEEYYASPVDFSTASYAVRAESTGEGLDGGFYNTGSGSDIWLTANDSVAPINFTLTAGSPFAIGGCFFVTDINGDIVSGTITASINGGQAPLSITTSSPVNFFGWVSTDSTPITSLSINTSTLDCFSTVNDLYVAIPEPASASLLSLACVGILFIRRLFVS